MIFNGFERKDSLKEIIMYAMFAFGSVGATLALVFYGLSMDIVFTIGFIDKFLMQSPFDVAGQILVFEFICIGAWAVWLARY